MGLQSTPKMLQSKPASMQAEFRYSSGQGPLPRHHHQPHDYHHHNDHHHHHQLQGTQVQTTTPSVGDHFAQLAWVKPCPLLQEHLESIKYIHVQFYQNLGPIFKLIFAKSHIITGLVSMYFSLISGLTRLLNIPKFVNNFSPSHLPIKLITTFSPSNL